MKASKFFKYTAFGTAALCAIDVFLILQSGKGEILWPLACAIWAANCGMAQMTIEVMEDIEAMLRSQL